MNNKTLISSIIVISIIVGLVIMFTSGPSDTGTSQQITSVEDNKALVQKQPETKQKASQEKMVVTQKKPAKVAKKPKTKKPSQSQTTTKASSDSSYNRIVRVSRPGQKYRMVRVEKNTIPPKSELRKWSRNQWVTKVTALQEQGEDSLAQDYISAYNNQYPERDLNNYLK